jgi:hypothetical protein
MAEVNPLKPPLSHQSGSTRTHRHRRRMSHKLRKALPWILLWGLAWAVFIAFLWFLIYRPEQFVPAL